ncbi:DUF6463 family protein [Streptomyces aureoverticillatus]|uniref:DUF6463 family protein n=1 Tax=Streptomyces aureoverticillatus TaxID=66871 RepID=UPI0013DB8264|nr:DUF6463 family protein [Streptomyces aureoverticillatus]QIB47309.1 hypothetical protein G3H79_33725 [Streptomyces aureoverticillatus]
MALPRTTRTARPSNPNNLTRPKLTRAAGWIAVAFGAIHIVVAPLDKRDAWSDIFEQGPWQTISLDVTPENLAYSEAFWVGPASCGVPVLLFGAFVLWTAKQGARVPAAFGWAMTAWGAVLAALLPTSPAWALLAVGVLLVLAARGPGAAEAETAES